MVYQLPNETMMGSISIAVTDLNRSLKFYRDLLGFRVLEETKNQAILTADGKIPLIRLTVLKNPKVKPARTTGLYHFAILVPDRTSFSKILKHFLTAGAPLEGASDHQFSEALYLTDPDGHGVEIYSDRPKDQWEKDEMGEYKGVTVPLATREVLALTDEPWNGMPEKTVIGHVHFHVSDLQKAERFFVERLGFSPTIHMADHALFVSAGGYHHHLGLNVWNGKGIPDAPDGSIHLEGYTILLPNDNEMRPFINNLRENEIPFQQTTEHVLLKDPMQQTIYVTTKDKD